MIARARFKPKSEWPKERQCCDFTQPDVTHTFEIDTAQIKRHESGICLGCHKDFEGLTLYKIINDPNHKDEWLDTAVIDIDEGEHTNEHHS